MLRRASSSLALALSLLACSGAKAPDSILKPLEERRAQKIMQDAIHGSGEKPAPGRLHTLRTGASLREDVAIAGGPYGIAYVSEQEARELGKAIDSFDPQREDLYLLKPAQDAIVLVLYERAYRYDAGDAHTVTAVTAERKLAKDVTDYVLHVVQRRKGMKE